MTNRRPDLPLSGRENLPIPNDAYTGPVFFDANDPATVYPPIQEVRPPKGAPNVLVVLIDDVGFGASSASGGPIGPDVKIEGNPFSGTIQGVQMAFKLSDEDHYVSDAGRRRITMAIEQQDQAGAVGGEACHHGHFTGAAVVRRHPSTPENGDD